MREEKDGILLQLREAQNKVYYTICLEVSSLSLPIQANYPPLTTTCLTALCVSFHLGRVTGSTN